MSTKRRGLGRHLEVLLGDLSNQPSIALDKEIDGQFQLLPLQQIQGGKYQPRKEFSEIALQELAESIRSQGVIQPIIVRQIAAERYEIVAGERRFRAASIAKLDKIPAIIKELTDKTVLAMALIENLQREDLNPIEEAAGLSQLIEEFGMTHQETAEMVGKSRTAVTNLLRLLALPEEIKHFLEQGLLDMGHARAILGVPEQLQYEIAKVIVSRGLSVREAEQLIRAEKLKDKKGQIKEISLLNEQLNHVKQKLSKLLNLRVDIKNKATGSGQVVIHYKSSAELENLLNKIQ